MSSKIFFPILCMYKMSSDAKRLTKERKITAKIYSKSKTTIFVHKNLLMKIMSHG